MRRRLTTSGLWLALLLSACSSTRPSWDPSDYTVRSGDTLYSIAWRYELDPEDLARWNNLSDSSFIRPGQRLHTRGGARGGSASPGAQTYRAGSEPTTEVIVVGRGDTLYALARQHRVDVKQLISINRLKSPYLLHPGQKIYTRSTAVPDTANHASTSVSVPPAIAAPDTEPNYPDTVRWRWPMKGKIISGFNSRSGDAKGINIAGREGAAVHAAAAGKVVYSGNGLISFGNLVIIKHNDAYLSAYAYNRKLVVAEGALVKAGQKIAETGKTDANGPVLHFEIRKHGKPVDPLRHLPPG